ncbi:tRNA (adenosine(37)-N6)-threonylcarbamoyltransferase complex dimerization subunit type 1 TsaB [Cryptosporangium phraense]|uniref:tRNA (Adenosine(37)-N6)-threonylcarbamoyltransferase complex dimerization subunit type 1 TsaB n=1 Tax=Cryptosporangium phraense TaxID=2593070 RepID=A0A545AYI9_9ACTN|nr:tRNA (adenosine(37)-N6)-threonylcarbamoyltransferase complex dimerization subunit type 1 TsaB [Cryptosporangium phraense]TQS46402.1 tRNA (adenosine(37)-N6)-threonylcarbamoyltransferase complex dimerization subunit type 1 TsaB [Cryptosporangium phraense]
MLALVVDTATAAVTVGIVEYSDQAYTVRSEHIVVDAKRHGETLAPSIAAAFSSASVRAEDLGAIVAGVGPGPFTGLRVGLVTAASLSDALGIPAYPVCSLDGLAEPGRPLLVATDARRREVYWAIYDADGVRVTGPDVAKPADLQARLTTERSEPSEPSESAERSAPDELTAVGSGAALYAEQLGLPTGEPLYPTVAGLARRATDRVLGKAPSEPLTPLYLRRPDAVEPGTAKSVLT